MNQRTRTGGAHQASSEQSAADRTPVPPGGRLCFALGAPTLSDIMGTMVVALTAADVHPAAGASVGAGQAASRRSR